jgi:peptidoglycan/LPS O-acetylase OafA/YrhL
LSYPLYITHYPLIYIYTIWVVRAQPTGARAFLIALLVEITAIIIAYTSLKLYDEPVRRWLSRKFLAKHGRV